MSTRMFPPPVGSTTTSVNGRSFTAAAGGYTDAGDYDVFPLTANGWTKVAAQAGVTSARPIAPARGLTYLDETLGYIVVFDGLVWRNPATGASV